MLCSLPNSFSNPLSHLNHSPASQLSDCKVFYFLDQQSNSVPDSVNFNDGLILRIILANDPSGNCLRIQIWLLSKFFPHKVCNISEVLPLRIRRIFLIKVPEQSTRWATEGTQQQAKGHLSPTLFLMCSPVESTAEGMATEMEPIL